MPARFGIAAALRAPAAAHVVTFALLVWWGVLADYGPLWYGGLVLTARPPSSTSTRSCGPTTCPG